MKLKNTFTLVATLLFVIGGLIGTTNVSTQNLTFQKQNDSLFVLETSENKSLNVPFASALAVSSVKDNKKIYTLRRDTLSVAVADETLKTKKNASTFLPVVKAFAVDSKERVYAAGDKELTITDAEGNQVSKFPIPPTTTSLAALGDGNVAVAAADFGRLITIYNESGKLLRKVGGFKKFNESNAVQNRFLNAGKVAVGQAGEIYYILMYSPNPSVQKFSKQGFLLKEFPIEGAALELQLKRAKQFLRERNFDCTGGYQVIKTLAFDPTTGHLWIGVNGSSKGDSVIPESGVLYEYSSEGEKLAEYALTVASASTKITRVITDIQEVAVNFPDAYVLTSGQVYQFDLSKRFAATLIQRQTNQENSFLSFIRVGWSLAFSPFAAAPQTACPAAIDYDCDSNCPAGSSPQSANCGTELKSRLNQGEVIISGNCQKGTTVGQNGGCSGSITGCASNGVQVTYSTTISCNAAPTPTPPPSGGGGRMPPVLEPEYQSGPGACYDWVTYTCPCGNYSCCYETGRSHAYCE